MSTTQKVNPVYSRATAPSKLVWEFAPTGPNADAYSQAPVAPPTSEPLSDSVMAALRSSGAGIIEGGVLGDWPSFEILVARDDDMEVIAAGSDPLLRFTSRFPADITAGHQWIAIMTKGKEDVALRLVRCHQTAPDCIALDSPPRAPIALKSPRRSIS